MAQFEGKDAKEVIAREAMHWCIALQEDPDDAQLKARFQGWLAQSPDHARAWEEVNRISGLMAETELTRERRAIPPPPARQPQARPQARGRWSRIAITGSLAAAACLLILFLPGLLVSLDADHQTGTAELRRIVLDDKSVVELAPDSAIKVDYSAQERRITLLFGQAFFDVESLTDRPFKVVTGELETTVLGTEFEVRRYANSGLVAVREGRVAVAGTSGSAVKPTQLDAGELLRLGANENAAPAEIDPARVAAWREGKLIVKNRPVGEIIETLGRYHAGVIVRAAPGLDRLRLTGIYDVRDPEQVLRAVALAHGLTVRRITPWVLTLSRI